jgi:hypothetical protein
LLGITPFWILGGDFWEHVHKYLYWEREKYDYRGGHFNSYEAQKIKKIEKYLLEDGGRLYYSDGFSFFDGRFKFRHKSITLGWYRLSHTIFEGILDRSIYWTEKWIERNSPNF